MCGIAGIISFNGLFGDSDNRDLKAMTEILWHRGPSHTGYYESPQCLVGNTRLAITDTDHRSDLPMLSEDENVLIAYNGFVSNFLQLKQKFRLDEKHSFRGNSDTEVLLNLYRTIGIDFVSQLNGMFAIFIFDKKLNKAWLVRDFFGIKPIFYFEESGKFYFASELKSLCEVQSFSAEVNAVSIFHYFTLAYIPGALTPYKNVHELRPGNLVEFDLNTATSTIRNYYTLNFLEDKDISETSAVDNSRRLMQESVERNLVADVPLGITLSGGVDSGLILSMAHRAGLNKKLITFSLRIDEPGFDESSYQRLMVDRFKPEHHEVKITPAQIEQALFQHIAYLDEPSGNGGNIPSYLLAQEARKHVTVLLSGEGGDEIFNGYDTHIAYKVSTRYKQLVPKSMRYIIQSAAQRLPASYKKLSFDFKMKRFTEGTELNVPEAHMFWRHVLTDAEKNLLFKNIPSLSPTGGIFSDVYNTRLFKEPLNRLSFLDIYFFFADDLMVKNDRMFMAHSLETRFPLMDRELVEYVSGIPTHLRVKNFKRRNIQKQAARGLIPDAIIDRRKSGLEIPYSLWVLDRLGPLCTKYFNKRKVEQTGILHWEAVEHIWKRHTAGVKDHGRAIWCILIFLIWHDMFVINKNYKSFLNPHP
ncbi:MAG: hypothetical protein JWO06_2509 [Bacteroidota bacterium]|nr:hypothetical protein [Bacteroidota bacterium]